MKSILFVGSAQQVSYVVNIIYLYVWLLLYRYFRDQTLPLISGHSWIIAAPPERLNEINATLALVAVVIIRPGKHEGFV